MFNKKILAASMAAAISTGMVAQVQAIQLQENNIGQLLLAPTYYTDAAGINTDITVVNTRTDAAVKAKIVFREGRTSEEVLDFILYLTPGDVWRGSVSGATNAAILNSTDDSMTDNGGNFGSSANPISQPFFDKSNSGQNGWGHFEVYGVYSVETGTYGDILVEQGMSKEDLRDLFANVTGAGGPAPFGAGVASDDPGKLQIMGEVQLTAAGNAGIAYVVPALGPDSYADGGTGLVVANNNFDASVGTPTDIGQGLGLGGADNILEIETALAAKDISFAYTHGAGQGLTGLTIALVTKYRHFGDTTGICGGGPASNADQYSAPFNDSEVGELVYGLTSFDNSENSATYSSEFSGADEQPEATLPLEINFLAPQFFSTSGWSNIGFHGVRGGCEYIGAPALSATLKSEGQSGFYWVETGDRRQDM